MSVRVLFFFVGGGRGVGVGWGEAPSPRLSLTCRVFSAPRGPLDPTSISVSAAFPILCDEASERDCASSSEYRRFMVDWVRRALSGKGWGMRCVCVSKLEGMLLDTSFGERDGNQGYAGEG